MDKQVKKLNLYGVISGALKRIGLGSLYKIYCSHSQSLRKRRITSIPDSTKELKEYMKSRGIEDNGEFPF